MDKATSVELAHRWPRMPTQANVPIICVAFFCTIGSFLFGLDQGYIGPIVGNAAFKRDVAGLTDWDSPDSAIGSFAAGFIVGVFALGCICSSSPMVSSLFLDGLGRKRSIIAGSAVFVVGAALQAVAGSVALFVVGRFIAGCSIGILSTVVPLYQSELAPPELRGALVSLIQLMIIVGVVVAALLDEVLLDEHSGWRLVVWLQLAPAFVLGVGMCFLPMSPRWLVQRGRPSDALRALQKYRSTAQAEAELSDITAGFEAEKVLGDPRWRDIFTGRGGRLLAVGMTIQLLQQLQGINAVIYFGPRIFKAVHILDAGKCQTITNLALLLGTLPAPLLADRCGRRSLLVWSSIGQGLPSAAIGILGLLTMTRDGAGWTCTSTAAAWAIAALVLLYVFNFAFGWGPMAWVYCGEMFPLRFRSRCVGLTTMANWIGVYVVSQSTPVLLNALGFGTFLIFAAVSLASLLLALWLPETKGLQLEHIDALFDSKIGVSSCRDNPKGAPSPASDSESNATAA